MKWYVLCVMIFPLLVLLLMSGSVLWCVNIGSDTAPTRFVTQQNLNNGDRIAGFAALKAGFSLNGTNVTGIFDSFFPVNGNVAFNDGTLVLWQDLVLRDIAWVGFMGNIVGNGHVFELAASVTCIPNVTSISGGELILVTETAETDNVETLDWAYDGQYLGFGTDVVNTTQPLGVYQFNGSVLSLKAKVSLASGTETELNSVRWHPSLLRLGVVRSSSTGNEIFVYDFTGTSLIQRSSANYAASCMACAWHTSGNYLAVGGQNTTSEIRVYPVSAGGILGTALDFNIVPSRNVFDECMDFNATGSYLAVGVVASGANPTLLIYDFNTAPSLSLTLNASINASDGVTGLCWNKTFTDVIAVGLAGTAAPRVILYRHNATAGTLTQITTIGAPFSSQIEGVAWTSDGLYLAIGSDEIGSGPEDAHLITYMYNNNSGNLTQVTRIDEGDDVEAVRYTPNNFYLAYGDDGFGNPLNLSVYVTGYALLNRRCVTFSDVQLVLNSDVCFQQCCLNFSGYSSINGQGHILEFKPSCTITVGQNASLLLTNIGIKGLDEYRLNGLDMNSTISFDNVSLMLDSDYTFTQGRFDVIGDLSISGPGRKFIYKSRAVSTVREYASLLLDSGMTFSYDPPIASQRLLQLTDSTSSIILNGATLHATTTGMRITQGTVDVKNSSYLSAEGSAENLGIIFGDTAAGTSVNIKVDAAAVLDTRRGCVQLDNA